MLVHTLTHGAFERLRDTKREGDEEEIAPTGVLIKCLFRQLWGRRRESGPDPETNVGSTDSITWIITV